MFANELKKTYNIYDLMAISYRHIVSDANFNIRNTTVNNKFHVIFSKYLEEKITEPCQAFNKLKNELYALYTCKTFTTQDYYSLIIEIDSCEKYEYNSSSCLDDTFRTYNGLNIIYKDDVKIYPKLLSNCIKYLNENYRKQYGCDFLREKKTYDSDNLNSQLKNYIIYCPKEFNSYDITFHELVEYDDFIFKKDKLKIVLFPTTNMKLNDLFDIKYTIDKQFYIKQMKQENEERLLKRYELFLDNLEDDIDFLIFPEMLMTEKIFKIIKNLIVKKGIKFVFCGSIWKDDNNMCYVLYEGDILFKYHKKKSFKLKYNKEELQNIIEKCEDNQQKNLLNDLYNKHDFNKEGKIFFEERIKVEKNLHIIDINNIGRISTYICRDIDDDSFINISKIIQNDFIFLPSCSPSIDLKSNATILAERYHCTTIMCNTCSPLFKDESPLSKQIENEKCIGFIITPCKNKTNRTYKNIQYYFNESCLKCESKCNGRFFSINIQELLIEDNKVSLNIKEISR